MIVKVRQAAGYLNKKGEPGLATFKERRSDYIWANIYVFVIDCEQKKVAANPLFGFGRHSPAAVPGPGQERG
jgi:hypothetical protein